MPCEHKFDPRCECNGDTDRAEGFEMQHICKAVGEALGIPWGYVSESHINSASDYVAWEAEDGLTLYLNATGDDDWSSFNLATARLLMRLVVKAK